MLWEQMCRAAAGANDAHHCYALPAAKTKSRYRAPTAAPHEGFMRWTATIASCPPAQKTKGPVNASYCGSRLLIRWLMLRFSNKNHITSQDKVHMTPGPITNYGVIIYNLYGTRRAGLRKKRKHDANHTDKNTHERKLPNKQNTQQQTSQIWGTQNAIPRERKASTLCLIRSEMLSAWYHITRTLIGQSVPYGIVRYGHATVWYATVWYGMLWCGTVDVV